MKTELAIRKVLTTYLKNLYGAETPLIAEVYLEDHARRIDLLALVGDKLIGFEIKSSSDSLTRLQPQIETYEKYLDKVVLVCASNHTSKATTILESNTGIWEISTSGSIKKLQRGKQNKIEKIALIRSLTVKDMRKLNHIPTQKVTRKELSQMTLNLPHAKIKKAVIESIKNRRLN